jgi:hypothetical protein
MDRRRGFSFEAEGAARPEATSAVAVDETRVPVGAGSARWSQLLVWRSWSEAKGPRIGASRIRWVAAVAAHEGGPDSLRAALLPTAVENKSVRCFLLDDQEAAANA